MFWQRRFMTNLIKSIKLSDIPNILTLFRILSIPIIILCLLPQTLFFNWTALIFYALACITDFFDGFLARRLSVESPFGKFFDPIADKILVISVIFILVVVNKIDGFLIYPSLIIIIREVLVSGLRESMPKNQPTLNVTKLSKIKTLLQMFSLAFLIIGEDFKFIQGLFFIGQLGLWISSIITIYTGYIYFKKNFNLFSK